MRKISYLPGQFVPFLHTMFITYCFMGFMGSHWEENVVNLDNIANARHTNGLDMKIVRSR
jgi:hypothetical protein